MWEASKGPMKHAVVKYALASPGKAASLILSASADEGHICDGIPSSNCRLNRSHNDPREG